MRHGGQILADHLAAFGVDRVFSVPGESFLAALDGLLTAGIPNIVCRHEGAAAMMAEATGKLTGRPGIAFVTRGPGATNAAAGVHIARQDSTPMILFVGQIDRGHVDREAFQEMDYKAVFGTMAKWVAEVRTTERLPEYIARAFHVATSGRPGPVVLALPEDMLSARVEATDVSPIGRTIAAIDPSATDAIAAALSTAARPLVVVGGPHWSAQASRDLARFATAWDLPVAVSFRRQDRIDNDHPSYAGDLSVGMNPKLAQQLREADLVLALGTRLGDIATAGYALMAPGQPSQRLIHVHPDPDLPGSVYRPDLAVTARADHLIAQLAALDAPKARPWADRRAKARADYLAWQKPKATPGAVRLEDCITWLSSHLPADAIITNGAGNYAAFLHRYFRFHQHGTQLAPTSGSMGYGFPAAIAAKLAHPERTVVCLAGDGCFQMTLNEMSTAMQHGAGVIVVVCNNGRYGTIRMHQEREYPGRVSGTDLANPDFAALAEAYGGYGARVTRQDDFAAAFDRARAAGTLAVIELQLDPDMLTTSQSLSDLRAR